MAPTAARARAGDRDRTELHTVQSDARDGVPGGPFHLILCRDLVFTYFDEEQQRTVAARFADSLQPGGALVLESHETFPDGLVGLEAWPGAPFVCLRIT